MAARRPETVAFWRGRLPHWEVVDGRYFVTIHLAGAIPMIGQERIHALCAESTLSLQREPEDWLKQQRRIYAEMEHWLDRTEYVDVLRRPELARLIADAIAFRQGKTWNMLAFVVMPSHVHLFFELLQDGLRKTLQQFKRWTGHHAAKLLAAADGTPFWQDEWFDHWSRSEDEDERIIEYIRQNPVKAGLVKSYLEWPFGSWSRWW